MAHRSRLSACSFIVALACVGLAACSPDLNWREIHPAATRLQALMPCKPDDATRKVPLDGRLVEMHLAGCDAGGATFVIGWADFPADRLGGALGAWQDATLERAGIAAGPDAPAGRVFLPPGALALPQSVRLRADGHAPDGAALVLQAAWFAGAGAAGSDPARAPQALFAAVYREPAQKEAVETFFGSLRLR